MALQTCKECGGQVSSDAKACPHCGSKSFSTTGVVEQFGKGLIGCGCLVMILALVAMVVAAAICGVAGSGNHKAAPASSPGAR